MRSRSRSAIIKDDKDLKVPKVSKDFKDFKDFIKKQHGI